MIRMLTFLVTLSACGGSSGGDTVGSGSTDTTGGTASAPAVVYDIPSGDLAAAIAGEHRGDNSARDPFRHPRETLEFFGIEPTMTVVEIRPGGGWYTQILAPYLKGRGQLVAGIPSEEGSRAQYRQRFIDFTEEHPELYGDIRIATFDPPAPIDLGEDGSADMVLTFRNTHNWINDGGETEAYASFFRVLRPGGILGVVQHRADEGADPQASAESGYVPQAYVIEVAQAAGFELVEASEINANPNDDHDHPEGVWTLPPVLRLGDVDRDQWVAVGESDRMTLKFRKPE